MKITIIISVYKNIKALDLILDSICNQSVQVDEIIVSEDGNSSQMKDFIATLNIENLIHLTQEDLGWRKNIALNNSIKQASSEYLVFIDGDVIPHKKFIEGHISCSEPTTVCVGKRSELGKKYSSMVYSRETTIDAIANNYLRLIFPLHQDKVHHYEDGIYSYLVHKITSFRKIRHIIGCNFSCYKKDIEAINGFNEDFIHPAVGEDVDITWRFRALGIKMKSCRYIANVYHLWHKKGFGQTEGDINEKIMNKSIANGEYICLNGLKKINSEERI